VNLIDRNGMTLISQKDIDHLHNLKHLFKIYRDTVAIVFKFSQENRPVTNLMSKLWRISDEIMAEMRCIGEVQDASVNCKDTGDIRR
jgi:hypothetical protein